MKANALKYWWIWQNDLLIVHTPKYNEDKDIQAIGCCCVVVVVGVLLFVCRRYIQLIDLTHKSIVAKHHGCHCLSIFSLSSSSRLSIAVVRRLLRNDFYIHTHGQCASISYGIFVWIFHTFKGNWKLVGVSLQWIKSTFNPYKWVDHFSFPYDGWICPIHTAAFD